MDPPGTEGRREWRLSTNLLFVGVGLFAVCVVGLVALGPGDQGIPRAELLFGLGFYVLCPASVVAVLLSFQGIRTRPWLAFLLLAAAYAVGAFLFLILAVSLGGISP